MLARKNGPGDRNRRGGASKGVSAASGFRRSGDHAAANYLKARLSALRLPHLGGLLDLPITQLICGRRFRAPGAVACRDHSRNGEQ